MKRYCIYLIVLVTLAGCQNTYDGPIEVTGLIEANTIGLGSRIGGRVSEVLVEEGDQVQTGDVLVKLEDSEAQAAVAAAQARVAQSDAMLAKLETGARPEELAQAEAAAMGAQEQYLMAQRGLRSQEIESARAAASAARAQRDEAKAEFERADRLLKVGAVTKQYHEQLQHLYEGAQAQFRVLEEKVSLAEEGARSEEINMAKSAADQAAAARDLLKNGARKEDLEAARAMQAAAIADLERAKVALDEMTVKATCTGVVQSIDLRPGDLVKPGAIVSVVDPEDLKLYVYVSSAELGNLRLGEKVPLTADSHEEEWFEGTINYISPTGEFTPRNLQTKEERVQQVFGVKIKLNSAGGKLRAGMTVTAHFGPAEKET